MGVGYMHHFQRWLPSLPMTVTFIEFIYEIASILQTPTSGSCQGAGDGSGNGVEGRFQSFNGFETLAPTGCKDDYKERNMA